MNISRVTFCYVNSNTFMPLEEKEKLVVSSDLLYYINLSFPTKARVDGEVFITYNPLTKLKCDVKCH